MLSTPLGDGAELRPLEPWQAEEFAEHADRWREDFAPWLGWVHVVTDTESARSFLQNYAEKQAADTGRIYGIWIAGELVGGTVFRTFDVDHLACELGVWLIPTVRGRGLVTRAAQEMIDWSLGVRGLKRVEWRVDTENTRSIAVAKRLGMTYEGTLRSLVGPVDDRKDIQIWALLAEEWRAQR